TVHHDRAAPDLRRLSPHAACEGGRGRSDAQDSQDPRQARAPPGEPGGQHDHAGYGKDNLRQDQPQAAVNRHERHIPPSLAANTAMGSLKNRRAMPGRMPSRTMKTISGAATTSSRG